MGRKLGIPVVRQSKLPVTLENLDLYKKEWQRRFDRLQKRYSKPSQQQTLDYFLAKTEVRLLEKYPNEERRKMPATIKEWEDLVSEYGPVAIGMNDQSQRLMLLIADLGL